MIFYNQANQLVIVSGLRTKEKAKVYLNTFSTLGGPLEQYYPKTISEAFYINNPNFGKVYRDKVLKEYIEHFIDNSKHQIFPEVYVNNL